MRQYRRLIPYALRQWRILVWIGVLTLLSSGAIALQPWPTKVLVDHALQKMPLPPAIETALSAFSLGSTPLVLVLAAALGTLFVFALNSLLDLGLTWSWSVAGQRMVADLASDLFQRLQRLSLGFHHARPVGDSLGRLTSDTWCVYQLADGILITPAQKIITFLTLGVVAWKLNPELAVCALTTAPLMAGATLYFGKRLKQRARLGREAQSRLLSFVQQTLSSIPAVQVFDTEPRNSQRYHHLASDAVALSQRGSLLLGAYGVVTGLITTAGTALIIFVGGRQVLAGKLSIGSFLVFLAYLRHLQGTAESFLKLYSRLKPIEASMDRVMEIFEAREDDVADAADAKPLPPLRPGKQGRVSLDCVTFGYEAERPVLREVSLEARPGETVALVGATGAGKTTLVSLIPRFYDPWKGRVLLDGLDVRSVQLSSLRSQIAFVLQDPYLFPASIAENIGYGRPSATREEIVAAARIANADDFIQKLPKGYDTVIGERGCTLSGGERQRLAIARALAKNAPVLILDEPTSALDAETEFLILQAMERLMTQRTTFIIAHRLSTIRRADQIVVLQNGRVVETGTHERLLANSKVYRRFHSLQFQTHLEEAAA